MSEEAPSLKKHPELPVHPEDAFANDKLDRKPLVETLMTLVSNSPGPFVMALDGGWGTGKTTFLDMWQTHAKTQEYICISINAWESDFTEDPLAALFAEIEDAITANQVGDWAVSEGKRVISAIKRDFSKVAKRGLKLGGLAVLAHLLKTPTDELRNFFDTDDTNDKIGAADDANNPQLAKILDQLGQEKINEYRAEKEALRDIKKSLGELAHTCKDNQRNLPILFFIDELDRCRPTYAVELLEVIKHIFEVPGFFFILAMNQEQLAHSIKTLYGQEMDAHNYLSRFFDITIRLPLGNREMLLRHWVSQNQPLPNILKNKQVDYYISITADINNISSRTFLQTLGIFKVAAGMLGNNFEEQSILLSYIFLKIIAPKELLYYELDRGKAAEEKILKIAKTRLSSFGENSLIIFMLCLMCRGNHMKTNEALEEIHFHFELNPKKSFYEHYDWSSYYDSVQNAVNLIQSK